jgi:hypothetical protein
VAAAAPAIGAGLRMLRVAYSNNAAQNRELA